MLQIIALLVGALAGLILTSAIRGLLRYLFGRSTGAKLMMMKFLWFHIATVNHEKKFTIGNFSPLCQVVMFHKDSTDAKEYKREAILQSTYTMLCILYDVLLLVLYPDISMENLLFVGLLGLGIWFLISAIMNWAMFASFVRSKDKRLYHITKSLARQVLAGVPIEELNITPIEQLECKASNSEKVTYQCFAFMQRVWMEDYASLSGIVASMEKYLQIDFATPPVPYVLMLTPAYYNLIFYYSLFEPDPFKAKYFFSIVSKDLKNDTDSGGRRVLAYYSYYVLKDTGTALKYIEEGFRNLPQYSQGPIEKEYEAKLLKKLSDVIQG